MKHVPPSAVSVSDTEFVLAALRCASQRLKLIDHQVIQIGAIDWCEQVAPGWLDHPRDAQFLYKLLQDRKNE
jgi:hypothetical protein